ncbi:MAG: hypothetical protein IPP91_01155 [Betaproteobacteria bacterium]|nr:hypothetical protein [Betaproteobacteria bacterium]
MNETRHDAIDRRLREDGRRAVPDDGFSLRIERALPPRRLSRAWFRPALVLGSAAIGSVLAWALAPAGTSVVQGFLDLARLQPNTPSALVAMGLAVAMAVTAAVLAAEEN